MGGVSNEPDLRLVPYAILVPGPIAALLIALFPGWLPVITSVAAVTIVALTVLLVREIR
ncbi:hypothetical protein BH23ACT10_BH23ACT10_35800 [soil metagenome]